MSEKIIGYTLLFLGILVILLCGFNIYSIFTKQSTPFNFITLSSIEIDFAQLVGSGEDLPPEQRQAFERQKASMPKQEIIAGSALSQMVNLGAQIFIMSFLASIGGRLASIGINLLKSPQIKPQSAFQAKI